MATRPVQRPRRDQLRAEERKRERFMDRLVIWSLCSAVGMLIFFVSHHTRERLATKAPQPFGGYGARQDTLSYIPKSYDAQQDPFFRTGQLGPDTWQNITIVKPH